MTLVEPMTLADFFNEVYPMLEKHIVEKVEKVLSDGTKIKAYWVVNIIRVDITPA